jgi:hypothetical protein
MIKGRRSASDYHFKIGQESSLKNFNLDGSIHENFENLDQSEINDAFSQNNKNSINTSSYKNNNNPNNNNTTNI